MNSNDKKAVLIVLDGWGYREEAENNAIAEAETPYFDKLWREYPHSTLKASGEAVGLPEGQMGNSEVGHITIGAGKTLDTDLVRITKAVNKDQIKENIAFIHLFDHVKKYDSTLHLLGLIGPGGVHAHDDHLIGILRAAKHHNIAKIAIHVFTDGRDTPPQSSAEFLKNLEKNLAEIGIGFIATITGRFYAMDRDTNWERIKKAEDALFCGQSKTRVKQSASAILESLYREGTIDELLEPVMFLDQNDKHYVIEKNDGVVFFNFRADRARQLSKKIVEKKKELNLCFLTLTQYDPELDTIVAFEPEKIENTLAGEIANAGLPQVHIAETEKFAHGTYYLNGGRQTPFEKEEQILIESRKDVNTHDEAPEMKAAAIAEAACDYIGKQTPFVFLNFANPDMVGHTGKKQAIIKALEATDNALKQVVPCALDNKYVVFITADHGNAEVLIDKNGNPHTAHTTNDVPAIIIDSNHNKLSNGTLADIAPTILDILNIKKPPTMTGKSLI